ncbi:MAG: dicarboxylate/amino acid:cation symporter [Spirochaetaceae bacterium]|nr:dicarboxylate/amino acid:cation symporter [Spirochaetaceae bacterium]
MRKNLMFQILLAFVVGLVLGVVLWVTNMDVTNYVKWVSPFGNVLVSMLKMIVVPVIFLSLISGSASLPTGKFGKVGLKVIVWYFLTSVVAAIIGSFLALLFNPGSGTSMEAWASLAAAETTTISATTTSASGALVDLLLSMFQNPFAALANGSFLAIIVFSIAFGLALKMLYDDKNTSDAYRSKIDSVFELIDVCKEGTFKLVDWILAYSPIGVFALTSVNFANYGSALFGPYVSLAIGVICGVLFLILVGYPIMVFIVTRTNPYKVLLQIKDASLTAFVTRSSAAALPVSMKVAEDNIHVDPSLSAFSLPLGATINMDGVCVHLPFFAVLAANMFGVDLGFSGLAILVLTTVLASIGTGGVPGGSLMLLFIILQNMGLSTEQTSIIVGLALGINPILDMFETMNNVTGDLICTYAVAKNSGMIEDSIKN